MSTSFQIGSYKSIAVEFPSTITVFEAPRNEDFNLRVIEAIVRQVPHKPIRYVVNSHQHFDAAAGLRTYFHIGATVITQWKNWELYNSDVINYAARTVKPDMVSTWPPTELAEGYYYETVRENYTIEEAGRVMRIYYVNPLQHVEGMLIAYLPAEKLLIQSDIVNTNNSLPATPTPDQQTLLTVVTRLGLDVERIVLIHGNPILWNDFVERFPE